MNAVATIDPLELRQVLGAFVTGVTVVTTVDDVGRPHGVTVNSFNSVSLDPPLILWSQALRAQSHPVYRDAERFAVNILADAQIDVSGRFAKAGADKFGPTAVRPGLGGVPLIEGCSAWLECRRVASHAAGDHMIFIGQVDRIERSPRRPLAFGGGKYLIPQPHDFGLLSAQEVGIQRRRHQAVRLATHAAVELAARLDETIGVAVWGNHGPTVVHWEMARHPLSVNPRMGAVLPVLGSATGLVFAAWLPGAETAGFIDAEGGLADGAHGANGEGEFAAGAVHDRHPLEARLRAIRLAGQAEAVTLSRFAEADPMAVSAVSVPVFEPDGRILLALTALGEAGRLSVASAAPVSAALRQCAEELTRKLAAPSGGLV